MRYHLRERIWTVTNDAIVRDDHDQAVFEIRGKFFSVGDDLILIESHTKKELVHIKQRLTSYRPRYDIFRYGAHWAEVHEKLVFFLGERFKMTGENGKIFHNRSVLCWWGSRVIHCRTGMDGNHQDPCVT